MEQFETRMRILFVLYQETPLPTSTSNTKHSTKSTIERERKKEFKKRHFQIDQSGEVDHNIWGKFQAVWAPCSTLGSSCNQQPPTHYYYCCCCYSFLHHHSNNFLDYFYHSIALLRSMGTIPTTTHRCRTSCCPPPRKSSRRRTRLLLRSGDPPWPSCRSSSLCSIVHQSVNEQMQKGKWDFIKIESFLMGSFHNTQKRKWDLSRLNLLSMK